MRAIITIIIQLVICSCLFAQLPTDSMYLKYQHQTQNLLSTRGMSKNEIDTILEKYKTSQLYSNEKFAGLLGQLYPSGKGIGILFYFFEKDNLTRIFFEPGRVIEKKIIPVTEKELLQVNKQLHASLNVYQLSAKRSPVLRGAEAENEDTAKYVYADIIKRATELLLPKQFDERYKHLIIIPALNIGTLPFHLLQPYKDSSCLIEKCSFTIAPGIIDLIALRSRLLIKNTKRPLCDKLFDDCYDEKMFSKLSFTLDNALFVSNPVYPTNTRYYFPDLAGAQKETDSAVVYAKHYVKLQGKEASKENVLNHFRESDVVYFATHGISSESKPMDSSFLVLSGNKDPFLSARNIMDMRDSTFSDKKPFPEMIILSACQTGLGKSMAAGIAGLARSFLIAGSSHVIMSLWNVDDNATAYLMNRFIYHLQQPHSFVPSEPLRLAILDAKQQFPNPAQWASFSLFGVEY